jgi:type I restriction enzyme S subunit
MSDDAIQATATKVVPPNSILLVSRVGVGKLAISRASICTSQDFTNFTPAKDDLVFLAYCIKSLKTKLLALNQGMAIKGFTKDDISNIGIPLPKLNEQQKIADCLSSLDELIAAQARKVDALKTHKKGLMQQLFPREGETQPRLRFPEFQDSGEWLPKTLGGACKMQAGKFVSAADIYAQSTGGLFPCFGGNGLRGYTVTQTHNGTYPLIGRQGALCGNVKLATGKFHATEHALVVTPNKGVEAIWLYYLLDLLNLNRFATGQAQPGLSVDVLEKVPVAVPKVEKEQLAIASCLSSLDTLIIAATEELETLKTHKKGLMQQLFPSLQEAV